MGLPVLTPFDINSCEALSEISALDPDIFIVASYGQFLGAKLLQIPNKAAINIHPSLLPRYRGASPIQWAIINGDEITGVTILYVDRRMDAGDIIAQRQCGILPDDTTASLKPRLARMGAEMTMKVLGDFRRGAVQSRPQDERAVVMAPKFAKEDGRIDFTQAAELIARRVRGLQPWPGSFFEDRASQRVRLLRVVAEEGGGRVGEIIDVGEDGPLIATGLGALRLLEVQPAGKRPMSGSDYANGQHLQVGEALV
jgi:methionyl-tRNA formyltransferase